MEFSSVERKARESVEVRRDTAVAAAMMAADSPTEEEPSSAPNGHAHHSHDDPSALPGKSSPPLVIVTRL